MILSIIHFRNVRDLVLFMLRDKRRGSFLILKYICRHIPVVGVQLLLTLYDIVETEWLILILNLVVSNL
jgi:hypothetical protein